MSVMSASEFVDQWLRRLCLIDTSTPSMNITLRVLSSHTSATLQDLEIRSSAYCCGVMLDGCTERRIAESFSAIARSIAYFFTRKFTHSGNGRKSVIDYETWCLRCTRMRQMAKRGFWHTCACSSHLRVPPLYNGEYSHG